MESFHSYQPHVLVAERLERDANAAPHLLDFLTEIIEDAEMADLTRTTGLASRIVDRTAYDPVVQGNRGAFFEGSLLGLHAAQRSVPDVVLRMMFYTDPASQAILTMDDEYTRVAEGYRHEKVDVDEASASLHILSRKGFHDAPVIYQGLVGRLAPRIAQRMESRQYVELGFGYVWAMVEEATSEANQAEFTQKVEDPATAEELHSEIADFLT